MLRTLSILSFIVASLAGAVAASAHHSFSAEFDVGRPVEITGAVIEVEWTNPHAWIHLETSDGEKWAVEMLGVNTLVRSGMTPQTVKQGDVLVNS